MKNTSTHKETHKLIKEIITQKKAPATSPNNYPLIFEINGVSLPVILSYN